MKKYVEVDDSRDDGAHFVIMEKCGEIGVKRLSRNYVLKTAKQIIKENVKNSAVEERELLRMAIFEKFCGCSLCTHVRDRFDEIIKSRTIADRYINKENE